MDIVTINALILPWFAVFFVPRAIRDDKTGEYLGYLNRAVAVQFTVLLVLQCILVLSEFGFNILAIARIFFNTCLPFILALVWLAATQKRMFGTKFSMKTKKGS